MYLTLFHLHRNLLPRIVLKLERPSCISKRDFQSKDREHEWCKDPYIFGCKPYEGLRSTSSKLCFKLREQVPRKQTWLADEKKKKDFCEG